MLEHSRGVANLNEQADMTKRTCEIDSCDTVGQLRRGMCSRHYFRWKRYGSAAERYRHCPKNHVLSPENVVVSANGQRRCRSCLAMKPEPDPCVVDNCGLPQLARGWCRKHYLRWYRLGDVGTPPRFQAKACSVQGCPEQVIKLGWCSKHHARWKKRGTTDDPPAKPAACLVNDCDRTPAARGWCKRHYKQLTGQGAAHEMRRYALKLGSQTEAVDYEHILAVHGMHCHLCQGDIESRDDLNMDHVVPLARGGSHTYDNIRPAHSWCNQRKHTKLVADFLADTGLLIT